MTGCFTSIILTGNCGLALQNGISVIDYPSPLGYFNSGSGIKGAVQ